MKYLVFLTIFLFGCSSVKDDLSDKAHEHLKRDYQVTDSNSIYRPGWIVDAQEYALDKQMDRSFKYFSYETGPKTGRDIACNMARANVKVDIAGEISSSIEKELTSKQEGDALSDENNPAEKKLLHVVRNLLVERIESSLYGVSIIKTYWEKRSYKKDLGSKKDFIAYTCAVYASISKDGLETAVKKAKESVIKKAREIKKSKEVEKMLKKDS
jgi:hypothetical protein